MDVGVVVQTCSIVHITRNVRQLFDEWILVHSGCIYAGGYSSALPHPSPPQSLRLLHLQGKLANQSYTHSSVCKLGPIIIISQVLQ